MAAMSVMSGKSLAAGEGGLLVTNDRRIFESAVLFTHYESKDRITLEELRAEAGMPHSGSKGRMVQLCAAIGRVQLAHYDERMAEIDRAMNRFWDLLEGTPGILAHRPPKGEGTMGGWYSAKGIYKPEQLGGLPMALFIEALQAEGVHTSAGANQPMHLHPLFNSVDVYGDGVPTRVAGMAEGRAEVRYEALPATEASVNHCFSVPWFKKDVPEVIEKYAAAFRKVCTHASDLMAGATSEEGQAAAAAAASVAVEATATAER